MTTPDNGGGASASPSGVSDPRCEGCEYQAALLAYRAGLGASEWEAFIDRVPPCDGCARVRVLLGRQDG